MSGSYASDLLPGMLIVSLGIGVILVAAAVSVLTGAREEESGMLSGLNTTGHEVGGSLGLAILATIATSSLGRAHGPAAARALAGGLGNAYTVAAVIAALASVAAVIIMPAAKRFLPRLALAPRPSIH